MTSALFTDGINRGPAELKIPAEFVLSSLDSSSLKCGPPKILSESPASQIKVQRCLRVALILRAIDEQALTNPPGELRTDLQTTHETSEEL